MLKFLSLTALLAVSNAATAEMKFNGFASIVGAKTMDAGSTLYGYNDEMDFEEGSIFALQGKADLSDGLLATVQIIGKGENDFTPEFEWAFLTHNVTDEISVNVGKQRIPFYMHSEYIDVGYVYPWIQPPQSVYASDFSTYAGVSSMYHAGLGDWDSSLQVYSGSYDDSDTNIDGVAAELSLQKLRGINWTLSNEWLTARIGYNSANVTVANEVLSDQLRSVDQSEASLIALDGDKTTFLSVGFAVEYNRWNIHSEMTILESDDSFFADKENYFVSVAYRIDQFTPFAAFEKSEYEAKENPTSHSEYDQLYAAQDGDTDRYTVGLRWDFHSRAASKIAIHNYKDNINSDNDTKLVGVSLDVIF